MRIAALADIHGNLLALRAVLADLANSSPDLVVNLGDHLSGPLEAAETADLLIAQSGWLHIRGNHDRRLVTQNPAEMRPSDRSAHAQVSARHSEWLRALPVTVTVEKGILLCHGTPSRDTEYLLEDVTSGFARLAGEAEVRARLGGAAGLILCGHSHVPRFVSLADGTAVLNPGSVGLQAYTDPDDRFPHVIEVGSPHARYALLDRSASGWRATFRAVEYDWRTAAENARAGNRPDWEFHLLTGRATR